MKLKNYLILFLFTCFWSISVAQSSVAKQHLRKTALIPYRDGNIWGFANGNNEIIIKPKFDKVGFFYSRSVQYTFVKKKKKYFFIDRTGKKIRKGNYNHIKHWSFQGFIVNKNRNVYFLNNALAKAQKLYACGGSIDATVYFTTFEENSKKGVVSTERMLKSEAIWKEVKPNYFGTCAVKKDSLWALIDKKLVFLTNYEYQEINTFEFDNYQFLYVKKDGKYGVLNRNGKVIVPCNYFKMSIFDSLFGLAKAWINENYWFYVDANGRAYYNKENIAKQ